MRTTPLPRATLAFEPRRAQTPASFPGLPFVRPRLRGKERLWQRILRLIG